MKYILTLFLCILFSSCVISTSYDENGNVTQSYADAISPAVSVLAYGNCYGCCERSYWFRPYSSCGPYWRNY